MVLRQTPSFQYFRLHRLEFFLYSSRGVHTDERPSDHGKPTQTIGVDLALSLPHVSKSSVPCSSTALYLPWQFQYLDSVGRSVWTSVPCGWYRDVLCAPPYIWSPPLALGFSTWCPAPLRPIMVLCPESVLLNINNFDEDKESLNMKLGNGAWKWLNVL